MIIVALLCALSYAQTVVNVPFRVFGRQIWCGSPIYGKNGNAMNGFMGWHKESADTENAQECANSVAADPECGQNFIMGSLYSFCMCVRRGHICNWETELDIEDHGTTTTVYTLGPRGPVFTPSQALESEHDSKPAVTDTLTPTNVALGICGMLMGFAAVLLIEKCRTKNSANDRTDRLI